MLDTLGSLRRAGRIRAIDFALARELARHAAGCADDVALAAVLASAALGRGNVCVELDELDGMPLAGLGEAGEAPFDADAFSARLRATQGVCGGGDETVALPLVLHGRRLYLGRYWRAEQRVALRLRALAERRIDPGPMTPGLLHRLFNPGGAGSVDQLRACAVAITRGLGVITGGPGTGKTTTVARLLCLLAANASDAGQSLAVRLAAPTGKAAARAAQSLARERAALLAQGLVDPVVAAMLPERAQTLHQLLGADGEGGFRYGASGPLPADVVIVDECSMVDLGLFDALLAALPAPARLVLLGDRDQLDAVEAGNVFGAICAGAGAFSPSRAEEIASLTGCAPPLVGAASALGDATAVLQYSHRFDAGGGIGRLAAAVNTGDLAGARAILAAADPSVRTIAFEPRPAPAFAQSLAEGFVPLLESLAAGADDSTLLDLLERYRMLCALREGDFGVAGLNRAIESALAARNLVIPRHGAVYAGQPVLVTRNDHGLHLYNGDLGLVVPGAAGREQVLFRGADGQPRRLPPGRLPEHETAFAMTIHKSQGSESDHVCIVLPPPGTRAEFGGREMLYTAITRARESVLLALPGGVLEPRWLERGARSSALAEHLHAG